MRPQTLLHLVVTASPLLIVGWCTSPGNVIDSLNQEARKVLAAQQKSSRDLALGTLYCQFAAWDLATEAYLSACDWARMGRDGVALGAALNGLGTVMLHRQRYELARQCFRDAAHHLGRTKDHSQHAMALHNLGVAYHLLGFNRAALKMLEKALALRGELWDVAGEALTLSWMGQVYCAEQQFAYALACYEAALDTCGQRRVVFDGQWFEAGLRYLIGQLAQQCGHADLAIAHYLAALSLGETLGGQWALPILHTLSQVHTELQQPDMAQYYQTQVSEIAEQVGASDAGAIAQLCQPITLLKVASFAYR